MSSDEMPPDVPVRGVDRGRQVAVSGYFLRHPGAAASEQLIPLPVALSGWGTDHMRGSAVTGALARSAEAAGRVRPDLRPVRFTVDLHTPAAMTTVSTESAVVRESGRLMLVDTDLIQDGRAVARARTLFLPASEYESAGTPWSPERSPEVPPNGLSPATEEGRLFFSEDTGWHCDAAVQRNSSRKQIWCRTTPVVQGEAASPFQSAATVADLTNLVTHWGVDGVRHINADIALALARHPDGPALGLSATGRIGSGAISVGTADMYDRRGVFGYTTVSTLFQSRRSVDTVAQLMRTGGTNSTHRDGRATGS